MGNPKAAKNRPQNWRTPQALYLELERRFGRGGFTLDAAADAESTKCERFLSEEDDALNPGTLWREQGRPPERVWINCPYSDITPWCARALEEIDAENAEVVVMLLPSRTGTTWFQDIVDPYAEVHFLRGRVAFERDGDERQAPFEDSLVAIFSKSIRGSR